MYFKSHTHTFGICFTVLRLQDMVSFLFKALLICNVRNAHTNIFCNTGKIYSQPTKYVCRDKITKFIHQTHKNIVTPAYHTTKV